MTIDKTLIRDFPPISANINDDRTGVLMIGATEQLVTGESDMDVRRSLIGLVQAHAAKSGRPMRVTTRDNEGLAVLLVSPEGEIEEEYSEEFAEDEESATMIESVPGLGKSEQIRPVLESFNDPGNFGASVTDIGGEFPPSASVQPSPPAAGHASVPAEANGAAASYPSAQAVPLQSAEEAEQHWGAEGVQQLQAAAPGAVAPAPSSGRRALRDAESFLATPTAVEPATAGLRGALNGMGLNLAPSAAEVAERDDVHEVSRQFTGSRTIAVVNTKGGAMKTPTVACLAAVFGRHGGSVLGWDNNETDGTLGWRTEQGDHKRTALDVLAHSEQLLANSAQSADINAFVHHQPADKYDVLRSDDDIDGEHEVSAEEVDVLHRVAAKYYRLILMDSGNNVRAANWNRMMDHTDQLVVPMTTMEDRAERARINLQRLDRRSERTAHLARNAVVVVSQWQAKEEAIAQKIADDFRDFVREVVIVPFDPALKAGQIRFQALRPDTRRAWLKAAAAVARGL